MHLTYHLATWLLATFLIGTCPQQAWAKVWDMYSPTQKQQQMVASAQKQYNKKHLQAKRKKFRSDCSGFVNSVLWDNGHSLDDFYKIHPHRVNGVSLIHKYVERVGWADSKQSPQKGDLVFFSNTYDKNKDGKVNDPLTHIGIIESIHTDGTVTFLHYIQNRVRRGYMNLKVPNQNKRQQKTINTYLRKRTNTTTQTLAAQLLEGFGRLQPNR